MTAIIEAQGLGKQYRGRWALIDCTLSIPAGHVVGLVGPNGAGKTTLLHLATGLLTPTAGTIEVASGRPAASGAQLARVGFVAQDTPIYTAFSGTQQQCNRFLATQHLRRRITYQPASRFWAFQAYETAIFVVLSLALAGFCVWWIRSRRLAR